VKLLLREWRDRWKDNRIGWHQELGNASLKKHWSPVNRSCTVLVPLCGKSKDLVWLANLGHRVIGIEVSEIGARAFFLENNLIYKESTYKNLKIFEAINIQISIYCGDYFDYDLCDAEALYDRGSIVAIRPEIRSSYVHHMKSLLGQEAYKFIISLEYAEGFVEGPPYSIKPVEMLSYWSDLIEKDSYNDIENSSPKFRKSGLNQVIETVWVS
jgi:thiopurine S-methyltransferase|tara:strand:+ start:106 stop:744 length:639 start_codon:yes stop_codon:yes gene_type:complete